MAVEARDIVRRAAGNVAGLTVAAQIRQASRHLGYAQDDWRPRELWYGRCASLAALADLKERFAAWRQREAPHGYAGSEADRFSLTTRLATVRAALIELGREVDAIAADLDRSIP